MPGGPHPPPSVIATWHHNYKNPERRGWGLVVLVCVLMVCSTITVTMRLWARLKIAKSAGLDDALIVIGMVPLIGLSVCICLGSRMWGFDRHVWDMYMKDIIKSRQASMAIESLWMLSTAFTKVSILLFYRRLASGSLSQRFLWATYAAIFFVVGYVITFHFTLFTGCQPLNAFWNQVDPYWNAHHKGEYTCINEDAVLIAASTMSIIQDFIACGMPLVLFWKLKISKRQKIALGALFGIGFFICIAGVLRIYYGMRLFYDTYDMTWEAEPCWAWTAVEAHMAVMCASAPALKVFFKKYFALQLSSLSDKIGGSWIGRAYGWRPGEGGSSTGNTGNSRKGNAVHGMTIGSGGGVLSPGWEKVDADVDVELCAIEVEREVDISVESAADRAKHDAAFADPEAAWPGAGQGRYSANSAGVGGMMADIEEENRSERSARSGGSTEYLKPLPSMMPKPSAHHHAGSKGMGVPVSKYSTIFDGTESISDGRPEVWRTTSVTGGASSDNNSNKSSGGAKLHKKWDLRTM